VVPEPNACDFAQQLDLRARALHCLDFLGQQVVPRNALPHGPLCSATSFQQYLLPQHEPGLLKQANNNIYTYSVAMIFASGHGSLNDYLRNFTGKIQIA